MMPAITLTTLPNPPKGWRPSRDTRRPDGKVNFESSSGCLGDDERRANGLMKAAEAFPEIDRDAAFDLAKRLLEGVRTEDPPETLASRTYYRDLRNRMFGWLWYRIEHLKPSLQIKHFTLIPRNSWVRADELHTVSPVAWKERLRGDLKRVGAANAGKGFIFAGLDGEFDADRQMYCLHYHAIVVGKARIAKVDKLRHTPKYRRRQVSDAPPVVRKPIRAEELPDRLTYTLKSFWKEIPKMPQQDGRAKRAIPRRIQEPHHSHWLLWMDQQRIQDMTLMIGIRASRQGIILSTKNTWIQIISGR